MRWEDKRPGEVRTYRHDWSDFLGTATIANKTVTVAGVTKDSDSNDTSSVTVTLSGGTAGTTASVSMTIVTSAGDTETEQFTLGIVDHDPPVSLAEAKAHLRVVDDSENEEIDRLVKAATRRVENFTGHILVRRTVSDRFDTFGVALELLKWPVISITSVGYVDVDGADQLYADFVPLTLRNPARLYPARDGWWPVLGRYGEVVVTYLAGYADGEVPEDLRQAILQLVAAWFQNREAGTAGLPKDVQDLCGGYRRVLI